MINIISLKLSFLNQRIGLHFYKTNLNALKLQINN